METRDQVTLSRLRQEDSSTNRPYSSPGVSLLVSPDPPSVLLTDGLTQPRHDGRLFGLDAVSAAFAGLHTPSPTDTVAILRARVAEFAYGALTDDLGLLAARIN
jgi:serine phosphatase RsbU (regulator of sigma subunit)